MLAFKRLSSGGAIVNYFCSSQCRHCVYASSPAWPKDYMDARTARTTFAALKSLGCSSVHIGGGEPLLRPASLMEVLKEARNEGMGIEYIETNASWFTTPQAAEALLGQLLDHGVSTLLVSIDPYHNEYIPFAKTKGLLEACRTAGMGVFPWRMEFWDDLASFDDSKPHRLEEYAERFGADYPRHLMARYGLNMRGRALASFGRYLKKRPVMEILAESGPCAELRGTQHFHADLYGNFIPQSCAGLSMKVADLAAGADSGTYPYLSLLDGQGIRGLWDYARDAHGFKEKAEYAGKCDLCYDLRRYLVMERGIDSPDLQPRGHYEHMA